MAGSLRRRGSNGLEAWPGYVDALSTLLMVIIFVLLVFVLAQAFLGVALSGRDAALERINRQVAEMSDMLSLERGRTSDLQAAIARLSGDLRAATGARDDLSQQLAAMREAAGRAAADRDALKSERDKLAAQLSDAAAQAQAAASRNAQLQSQIADAAKGADQAGQASLAVAAQLAETRRQLAAAQARAAEMERQLAEADRTVKADKETIEARLSDLAKMAEQTRALAALRDELEKQAQEAAAQAMTEAQRRAAAEGQLSEEKKLGDSARAQIALLNRQVTELRAQLGSLGRALELAQAQGRDKDVQIANLGQRLNAALAAKVEELQRYRSEFFGKLREVLANRQGIQVVGDRFVFQSEVLFPPGSAEMTGAGQEQIRAIAGTIKQIATDIPRGINWILRVDGHADKLPVTRGTFVSNWELSAARAITVVKLLIAEGVPAEHLAATGFADFQPLDTGDSAEAYAKNRRIELRLTDR